MRIKEDISEVHGQTCPFDQTSMGPLEHVECQDLLV